jgi:hypothetical protein
VELGIRLGLGRVGEEDPREGFRRRSWCECDDFVRILRSVVLEYFVGSSSTYEMIALNNKFLSGKLYVRILL